MSPLSHTIPGTPAKGPRKQLRPRDWAGAGRKASSLTAWIHHGNSTSAQPLRQDPFIPQTLRACSVPGPELGSAAHTVVTKTVPALPSRGAQSTGGDR